MIFDALVDVLRATAWTLLPPAGLFWIGTLGAILYLRWRRTGGFLVGASFAVLVVLALPITSYAILSLGEVSTREVELEKLRPENSAILVLGGDVRRGAQEYGSITLGPLSLERLRYAARLHRRTGLPILVSGGPLREDDLSLAALMNVALAEDFQSAARWLEDRSRNTAQNARFSAEILRRHGISTVLVVTHAWHMRRALMAFRGTGLSVVPVPTLATRRPTGIDMVIPSVAALYGSSLGIHEFVGCLFYRFMNFYRPPAVSAE